MTPDHLFDDSSWNLNDTNHSSMIDYFFLSFQSGIDQNLSQSTNRASGTKSG